VAAVADRLTGRRLVTLIGPAGTGKTTVAALLVAREAPTVLATSRSPARPAG